MSKSYKELLESKIHEEAFSIEQVYFTKTDKKVNPKKVFPFKYWKGNIPVLISAPHAVRHERRKKIKVSDQFTGSLAYLISSLTGAHALAVTKLYGGDPNFDSTCIYKEYLEKVCRENNISLIIDLHGAAKEHPFDVDVGTMLGGSLIGNKKYHRLLLKCFYDNDIKNLSQETFPGIMQNTIIKFSSEQLKIPAIQLEINRKYRAPNQSPEAYCKIVAALVDFIKYEI